jgi:hypothetical protein
MSQPNPNNTDAILGGQNPPPVNAVVLGGLAGVKQRLENGSIDQRLQALNDAVQYGDKAIELVIQALTDESPEVQVLTSKLLRYSFGLAGEEELYKYALDIESHYDPFNQPQKLYDYKTGITAPEDTTYVVRVESSDEQGWSVKKLDYLIDDSNIKKMRSMIIELESLPYLFYQSKSIVKIIDFFLARNVATRLKSLGIHCREPNECALDYNTQDEIICSLNNLILDSAIAQNTLKYFRIKMSGYERTKYIDTNEKDKLNNWKMPKSSWSITNMRISSDGNY